MASWIDANPAQRLHQYTLPAARREVAEAPAHIEALKAEIAKHWAQRAMFERSSYEYRAVMRRVRSSIRDLRIYQRQVQWSKDLIAKHSR